MRGMIAGQAHLRMNHHRVRRWQPIFSFHYSGGLKLLLTAGPEFLTDQATADAVVEQALCRTDQISGLSRIAENLQQDLRRLLQHRDPARKIGGMVLGT